MCNLDIIAGPLTEEQLFNRWLYSSLQDAEFVTALVIFGAVFIMLLSVLALFSVMLVKHFKEKSPKPGVERDGSVPLVPFLCSVIASLMFLFGVVVVLMIWFISDYFAFYWTYTTAGIYAAVMAGLFIIALCFSPRASKAFKRWNTACLIVTLLAVFCVAYFWLFVWFARGSVEVLG